MFSASHGRAPCRSDVPVFLAAAADHKRKAETSKDLFEQATHAALARQWADRADAARWGR